MRRYTTALVLVTAVALAGCSSSAHKAASDAAKQALASTTTSGSSSGDSSTTASGSTGKVDCAKVKAAMPDFIVAVQHLAALKSADDYALIQNGTIQFDPDTFATAVDNMRSLEGVDLAPLQSPGAVKKALDNYAKADALAKTALASSDPWSTPEAQQLATQLADTASFLGGQTALGEAASEAHCA